MSLSNLPPRHYVQEVLYAFTGALAAVLRSKYEGDPAFGTDWKTQLAKRFREMGRSKGDPSLASDSNDLDLYLFEVLESSSHTHWRCELGEDLIERLKVVREVRRDWAHMAEKVNQFDASAKLIETVQDTARLLHQRLKNGVIEDTVVAAAEKAIREIDRHWSDFRVPPPSSDERPLSWNQAFDAPADCVERDWLFEHLQAELNEFREHAGVALVGDPGSGKSVALGQLARTVESGGRGIPGWEVAAFHACRAGNPETLRPERFVTSLACQLDQRLGGKEYLAAVRRAQRENDTADRWMPAALSKMLGLLGERKPPEHGGWLIVVDGLDEAEQVRGQFESILLLIRRLAAPLPRWIRLLVSSRPDDAALSRIGEFRLFNLNDQRDQAANDVLQFFRTAFDSPGLAKTLRTEQIDAADAARRLAELAAGSFVAARLYLDIVRTSPSRLAKKEPLPIGRVALLDDYWQRVRQRIGRTEAVKLLGCVLAQIAAAGEPLSTEQLAAVNDVDENTLSGVLAETQSLLIDDRGWRPFHETFREWLRSDRAGKEEIPRAAEAQHKLADWSWGELCRDHKGVSSSIAYAVRWLGVHLAKSDRKKEVADRIWAPQLLEAAVRLGDQGLHRLEQQLGDLLRWERKPAHRGPLVALQIAINRHREFLRRHPEALFQCVWNECADPEEFLDEALAAPRPIESVQRRLDAWRLWKHQQSGGFRWLRSLRRSRYWALPIGFTIVEAHESEVVQIVQSSDGRRTASLSSEGEICVWDGQPSREQTPWRIKPDGHAAVEVALSPDGQRLAVACQRNVTIWNVARKRRMVELMDYMAQFLEQGDLSIQTVGFWPNGQVFFGGAWGWCLAITADDEKLVWDLEVPKKKFEPAACGHYRIRLEGNSIELCPFDGGEAINLAFPEGRNPFENDYENTRWLVSDDSGRLGCWISDEKCDTDLLFVWDLNDQVLILDTSLDGFCRDVVMDSTGERLAIIPEDDGSRAVSITSLGATTREVSRFFATDSRASCLARSTDGTSLLVGSATGRIFCWERGFAKVPFGIGHDAINVDQATFVQEGRLLIFCAESWAATGQGAKAQWLAGWNLESKSFSRSEEARSYANGDGSEKLCRVLLGSDERYVAFAVWWWDVEEWGMRAIRMLQNCGRRTQIGSQLPVENLGQPYQVGVAVVELPSMTRLADCSFRLEVVSKLSMVFDASRDLLFFECDDRLNVAVNLADGSQIEAGEDELRPLLGQGSAADQQHFALVTEGSKVHPIKAAPELPAAVRLLRFPDEVLLETRDTGEPIGWFPCAIPPYKENEMVASRDGRTWAASDGSYVYVFQVEHDQAD